MIYILGISKEFTKLRQFSTNLNKNQTVHLQLSWQGSKISQLDSNGGCARYIDMSNTIISP